MNCSFYKKFLLFISLILLIVCCCDSFVFAKSIDKEVYNEYIDFFEEVYDVMKNNYYKEVLRKDYKNFLKKFKNKIYSHLKETGKSNDYVKWRSASMLINSLKASEDIFSEFYPPKPAKEYEQTALGKKIDLGIKGELIDVGYKVSFVEPRSDAYTKGLREYDLVRSIDKKATINLDEDEINELLNPLKDYVTELVYVSAETKKTNIINIVSKEYFKQAVFPIRLNVPGIYGLELQRFNRKTGDDVFRFISYFKSLGDMKGLIIDLRNNPGGPPLAARELSSFFLPAGEEFAYFKRRNNSKAILDVPGMSEEYKYDGPMVILINEKSGSASELFSGVMQKRGNAVLMGQNSAGQVMLKSMFHLDDDSMILLITGRGHHPDGKVFSFGGLIPDRYIENDEENDILKYATMYLLYANKDD